MAVLLFASQVGCVAKFHSCKILQNESKSHSAILQTFATELCNGNLNFFFLFLIFLLKIYEKFRGLSIKSLFLAILLIFIFCCYLSCFFCKNLHLLYKIKQKLLKCNFTKEVKWLRLQNAKWNNFSEITYYILQKCKQNWRTLPTSISAPTRISRRGKS